MPAVELRGVEDVFVDWCGRRRGILRALTTEVEAFFQQCSPDKENLCLYGYSDGTWEAALPCEEVPPELPEPTLGINFARDGMARQDWLSLVAVHSDSWLLAVAFFNGARLDAEGRRQLFKDINALPTTYEIVSGRAVQSKGGGASQAAKRGAGEAAAKEGKRPRGGNRKHTSEDEDEEEEEGVMGHGGGSDPCPNCGRLYRSGEFWIQCDACDRWFDGKCVNMTPQKAEKDSEWQCLFCTRCG